MREIIQGLFSIFLILGLIFFIWSRAIPSANMKKRGVILLVLGLLLTILFMVSFFVDYQQDQLFPKYWAYFGLTGIALAFTLSISIPLIVRANKYHIHLTKKYRNRSYFAKQEYVYIVYRKGLSVYLQKDGKGFKGELVSLKNIHFHDDAVEKTLKKLDLEAANSQIRGMTYLKGKKEITYYCYLVDVKQPLLQKNYVEISLKELSEIQMQSLDKEIILRMMLSDTFEIHREVGK
jgi:hypothetical protein